MRTPISIIIYWLQGDDSASLPDQLVFCSHFEGENNDIPTRASSAPDNPVIVFEANVRTSFRRLNLRKASLVLIHSLCHKPIMTDIFFTTHPVQSLVCHYTTLGDEYQTL